MNDTNYTKYVTKIKRGTGTRDQDTTKIVTKNEDPATAAENHEVAIQKCLEFADNARIIQPGEDA